MTVEDMNVAQQLDALADEIEAKGWTRGTRCHTASGNVCLFGAVENLLGLHHYQLSYEYMTRRMSGLGYLAKYIGFDAPACDLTVWNDFVDYDRWSKGIALGPILERQSGDDIISTLRSAAKQWWEDQ